MSEDKSGRVAHFELLPGQTAVPEDTSSNLCLASANLYLTSAETASGGARRRGEGGDRRQQGGVHQTQGGFLFVLSFFPAGDGIQQTFLVCILLSVARRPTSNSPDARPANQVEHKLGLLRCRRQVEAFLKGLHEPLPRDTMLRFSRIVSVAELDLLLAGLPEVDIDDWEKHAAYLGGLSAESDQAVSTHPNPNPVCVEARAPVVWCELSQLEDTAQEPAQADYERVLFAKACVSGSALGLSELIRAVRLAL